jgi:hypothetical protein
MYLNYATTQACKWKKVLRSTIHRLDQAATSPTLLHGGQVYTLYTGVQLSNFRIMNWVQTNSPDLKLVFIFLEIKRHRLKPHTRTKNLKASRCSHIATEVYKIQRQKEREQREIECNLPVYFLLRCGLRIINKRVWNCRLVEFWNKLHNPLVRHLSQNTAVITLLKNSMLSWKPKVLQRNLETQHRNVLPASWNHFMLFGTTTFTDKTLLFKIVWWPSSAEFVLVHKYRSTEQGLFLRKESII